jgi:Protein of unknown function (DUF4012)
VYTRSNLSNQIIPYHQKLQKLKKVPDKKGVVFSLFKNQLKQGFFVFITSFIIFNIVLTSFLTHVSAAKSQVAENSDLLNLKVKNLIELAGADRQSTFQSIKKIVKDSLTPVTGFTNTQWVVDRDMDKIENLANSWLNATSPLTLYSFSSVGFEHKSNPDRLFTNDLEDFFDELPSLQVETERVWSEMWLYRIIGNTANDQKIKDLISSIEFFIKSISSIIQLKPLILKILGHYSTQRMVIFNQNVGEARPTGGFIGSHIPLDISQGKIVIGESQSIYYIDGQKKEGVVTHPSIWYSNKDENIYAIGGVRNLNIFNCFPDSASIIEQEFATSGNGYTIDQLVMVTPQIIEDILPDGFSINVSNVGNITKSNFASEVERVSSFQAPDKSNPKSLLSPIFLAMFEKLPDIMKKQGVADIFKIFAKSLASRDVNIWFRDFEIQKLSSTLGFASDQVCKKGNQKNIISPIISNVSGDKRGLISQNKFSVNSESVWGGKKINIRYTQILPESKNLQRAFNDVSTFNMFAFQIPQSAFAINVESENIIKLPYIREGYLKNITNENKTAVSLPGQIKTTIDTGRDLENGGFTYNQADGSLVVGAYISDNSVGETRVDFEFTIPAQVNERIDFFGQPGLNEPSLFLGEGIDIYKNPTIREISDAQKIQSGITLITK